MKVTLRKRRKRDKVFLYLDYYHKGMRKNESLKLYLIPDPAKGSLTRQQKEQNRKNLELAEMICSKRHLETQYRVYGFQDREKLSASFLDYFEMLAHKRRNSDGNYGNWLSCLKHLKRFSNGSYLSFEQVDSKWLESFKEYLTTDAKSPANKPLATNSALSYFNKVKAALKQSLKDGIIQTNPAEVVDGIKAKETQREFLTLGELRELAKTDCSLPVLKSAFIFCCLTGLRFSDVQKLSWKEVQHSKENGNYLRYRQKKTSGTETLPISEQARDLLGERTQNEDSVFKGLKYSAWNNTHLKNWIVDAGIKKKISFHCSRHTYSVLQLSAGTDIYTLSKLLGHRHLKTTEIYSKVVDEKKHEASERIKL